MARQGGRPRLRVPTYETLDRTVKSTTWTRRLMNVWPPLLFSSIRIVEADEHWRHLVVRLKHSRITANYVGTLYGGSLYSMTDPFWMMMIARNLGREYTVWDARGEIRFVAPGRSDVTATFDLSEAELDEIRAETADGARHLRWFSNTIVDAEGTVIAEVRKQVYVRKRPRD